MGHWIDPSLLQWYGWVPPVVPGCLRRDLDCVAVEPAAVGLGLLRLRLRWLRLCSAVVGATNRESA